MRILLLTLLFTVVTAAAWADSAAPATPTVQALGLEVRASDVIVTAKKGYAHLLWDAFPLKEALPAAAKAQGSEEAAFRQALALELAKALVPAKAPGRSKVKVDVVEFPERDEYGAPRWSSVKKIQRFELEIPLKAKASKKK